MHLVPTPLRLRLNSISLNRLSVLFICITFTCIRPVFKFNYRKRYASKFFFLRVQVVYLLKKCVFQHFGIWLLSIRVIFLSLKLKLDLFLYVNSWAAAELGQEKSFAQALILYTDSLYEEQITALHYLFAVIKSSYIMSTQAAVPSAANPTLFFETHQGRLHFCLPGT